MEVDERAVNVTGADCTAGNFSNVGSASSIVIVVVIVIGLEKDGLVILGQIVVEHWVEIKGSGATVVLGQVLVTFHVPFSLDFDAKFDEESVDFFLERRCFFPEADVFVDLVEEVVQAAADVFQVTLATLAIAAVGAATVSVFIPRAVSLVFHWTRVSDVSVVFGNFAVW